MIRVKVCGITTSDDAQAAVDAGVDAIGLNFAQEAKKRGRYVDPEEAMRIAEQLPPFVATVAVCVNEPVERLREYLEFVDWVQLHGEESGEVCQEVGRRAIKAFRLAPGFQVNTMTEYPAAAYLVDAYQKGARGGTGTVCDWPLAREAVALGRPIILAGGLTPENVAQAIREVRPYAVDTAGGVESALGKKDHERIREFVRNAKGAVPVSG